MESEFLTTEPSLAPSGASDVRDRSFRFDGQMVPLLKLYLKNIVLTLLTLGVYRFWAKVEVKRFLYQHTVFYGGRFGYHATGREKFFGFLKGMLILLPLIAGVAVLYAGVRNSAGDEEAFVICFYTFIGMLGLLRPLIVVGSRTFNLSRTSWNNLRFRFNGRVGELYVIYLRDFLFMVLTLGIYASWHQVNVRRYTSQHSLIGDEAFDFNAKGGDLFGIHFLGVFFTYITVGIYFPWYRAKLHRFYTNHTRFQGWPFESTLTGLQMLGFGLKAVIAVVLTLGLAFPWVIVNYQQMVAGTTRYTGIIDLQAIQASYDDTRSATIEGIGEAGEALESIGEFFGG